MQHCSRMWEKLDFWMRIIAVLCGLLLLQSHVIASTILSVPRGMDTEELNQSEKDKFRTLKYNESIGVPEQQYKGPLKFTEGEEEVYFKSLRALFGFGMRYSIVNPVTMKSSATAPSSTTYFERENGWNFDRNVNFFASGGVYWRNGIRIEFEYSKMTLDTKNFARNFATYNGIVFNQYLQKTGYFYDTTSTDTSGVQVTTHHLTDNMVPVVEFSVITYMVNVIFEQSAIKPKIRPYAGGGIGIVSGSMDTLVNDGRSSVPGVQIMLGLSYVISDDVLVLYLGYRGIFAREMKQTFSRIYGASAFDGVIYDNPLIMDSEERFTFRAHNIDLGVRFFF